MRKPSRRYVGLGNRWQLRVGRKRQRMTLRAGLPPNKFFRLGYPQRDPFLRSENSRRCSHRVLRKISIWLPHAKLRRMAGDVLLKFLKKERVNYGRSVVGDFLLKARVKLQAMTCAAMFCVRDGGHVRAPRVL